ncbi:MAG: sensor histidine kinase, partial [Myxococcaceae bacterium]
ASHELRTPLQAAKGHTHLALKKLGDSAELQPLKKSVVTISRQIDRMAKLVEDLLDISRLQAGRLQLEMEEFDVVPMLRETVERVQGVSTDHQLSLQAPDELRVRADRSRLEQVVTNLLSNAIRYSPRGGPVQVTAAENDGELHLSVSDRGVGIPLEKQAVIFERFGQAHGARYGGLGLGLTISQGIVAQHGGRIEVESSGVAGEGTTFRVRLPLPARDGHSATGNGTEQKRNGEQGNGTHAEQNGATEGAHEAPHGSDGDPSPLLTRESRLTDAGSPSIGEPARAAAPPKHE